MVLENSWLLAGVSHIVRITNNAATNLVSFIFQFKFFNFKRLHNFKVKDEKFLLESQVQIAEPHNVSFAILNSFKYRLQKAIRYLFLKKLICKCISYYKLSDQRSSCYFLINTDLKVLCNYEIIQRLISLNTL